jgi:hypothetical protein
MSMDPLTPSAGLAVVTPADPDWDEARRAWNLAVDQRPEAVALPAGAGEVAAAIGRARDAGLRVAVQGTGHGAGARGAIQGAMLVSTARMRAVEIDADARTARAGAGALWLDVVPAAAEHGLAALHGSGPDVGVTGYTLGGGLGWLGRRHGLACNAVTAVELVTAGGEAVRVDASSDPDLFWALRGGGGSFGVVTAIEFRLLPIDSVHAGWLVWPWEEARGVLTRWAEWTGAVPDEVTSVGRLLQVPPLPELPDALRGRQLVVVEAALLADEGEAARLLEPLRELGPEIDTFAQAPATALSTLHMDPPEPVPGVGDTALIDALPAEAIDAFVAACGPGSGSPLVSVELRHLGGALGRVPDGPGALGRCDGDYLLFAVGVLMDPSMSGPLRAALARAIDAVAPWGRGRRLLNFADSPADTRTMFDPQVHERLREIRARVDPEGLLQANHPIPQGA